MDSQLHHNINPDEAIAYGAAIIANGNKVLHKYFIRDIIVLTRRINLEELFLPFH